MATRMRLRSSGKFTMMPQSRMEKREGDEVSCRYLQPSDYMTTHSHDDNSSFMYSHHDGDQGTIPFSNFELNG